MIVSVGLEVDGSLPSVIHEKEWIQVVFLASAFCRRAIVEARILVMY